MLPAEPPAVELQCARSFTTMQMPGLPKRASRGAIPVTSSGVNLLEELYHQHVMFVFSPHFCQLTRRRLNTPLSSTLKGHFYLKR